MQIKGMQAEEGSSVSDDHTVTTLSDKRPATGKQDVGADVKPAANNGLQNGNGSQDGDIEGDVLSNGDRSHHSPTTEQETTVMPSNDIGQPLSFELGNSNSPGNNFWPGSTQEDANMFQNFQPINATQSMPTYGLNNNNSFPPPIHFGSIGQPTNYMPSGHGQFHSPPSMHGMSMMGNMGPMNGPMGGVSYQNSHSQNQRRAITAQHNYGSMSGKPMNHRFSLGAQPNPWPTNMSPWTVAIQNQKALNRPGNMNTGPVKKGQSSMHINHSATMNNPMMPQHKYGRHGNPLHGKSSYTGSVGGESMNSVDMTSGYQSNGDSMKMDSLQTQLMDIMRHPTSYEQEKGFSDGIGFNGDDLPSNNDPRSSVAAINGTMPLSSEYRGERQERYSRKVFVGGLPPDIDEEEITGSFRRFGPVVVDWPHKAESKSYFPPKGYCFLLFQEEVSVQALIDSCLHDDSKMYWCVTSPTMKDKPVQIRPWSLSDSDFVMDGSQTLDPRRTIFVGGVPRPLRAYELGLIIDRLYGGVCYAGIDTDPELKYPKGAGRVAFSNHQSYIAAISARFVQLQHGDIDKRVEVKPYVLDDQVCDECGGERCNHKFAPFFCANVTCLQYYCEHCWGTIHSRAGREYHKPLIKEGADRPRSVPFRWC